MAFNEKVELLAMTLSEKDELLFKLARDRTTPLWNQRTDSCILERVKTFVKVLKEFCSSEYECESGIAIM